MKMPMHYTCIICNCKFPSKEFDHGKQCCKDCITREGAIILAKRFHETYEKLAPQFNYKTRKESKMAWDEVPEDNKNLMIATCAELLRDGV